MKIRRPVAALPALLAVTIVTACASPTTGAASDTTAPDAGNSAGHGEIAGAAEVAEAPLALLSVDRDGGVGMLDLASDESVDLGRIPLAGGAALTALASDGRYGFVSTGDGLQIIDSGRWSWHHGDHFHFYLAEPRILGDVPGEGPATVSTGLLSTAGTTGVFFAGSGEGVLLDNEALSDGEIVELFRIDTGANDGLVAPLGPGAAVAVGDRIDVLDASGATVGSSEPCVAASGAVTTTVGLVIGCADGAVLVTVDDAQASFERIPYPGDVTAERATTLDGRKGRTAVAGAAGDDGFWLLDARERAWEFVATDAALVHVSAVDDEAEHVVGVDRDGRVHVHSAEGVVVTDPVVTGAVGSLTVDARRAYLNDPEDGVVIEIDFADAGRVARVLSTPTRPWLMAEVGR
ncbi:ABC transporter [Microbacterium esteraromaticum]|uniref:ABC transporter n=1 Tax=Microbacterium esteraromaticum TaxID=57043 RepID=A0A939DW76_9MICO|nr:ABC transporter [Microbacterium esteraromaticum]MBN8205183.1 ABC transporter [Microbacterium esteraromaticum]MBN8415337.1 ABC transporter [Microbacterium esteraromaticum]